MTASCLGMLSRLMLQQRPLLQKVLEPGPSNYDVGRTKVPAVHRHHLQAGLQAGRQTGGGGMGVSNPVWPAG